MPELPDVEMLKKYLESTALHKEIEGIDLESAGILRDISEGELNNALKGHRMESSYRRGKYLFVELDSGRWLTLHFGMTGGLAYFKDTDKKPRYTRMLLSFDNGYHLAYISQRKLGSVRVVDDVDAFIEDKRLGRDALNDIPDFAAFKEALGKNRSKAKSALMDQKTIAGIGNVYSDEMLFQAGIHPRRKVNELDEGELKDLFEAMRSVLRTAIDRGADARRFPDSYLVHHRGRDEKCPKCGGSVEHIKVSGRTAYYCPKCQPMRS